MEVPGFLVLNIYTLLLLTITYFFTPKNSRKSAQNIVFNRIRNLSIILLIADTCGRFNINPESLFSIVTIRLGNFLTFILDPLMHLFMLKYIDTWITKKEVKHKKFWFNFMDIFIIVNTIMVFVSEFSQNQNLIYYYDSNYIYHRGEMYFARGFFILLSMIIVELYTICYLKYIENENKKILMIFPVIPIIFGVIHGFITVNLGLEYTGVYLSCMIVSQFVQRKESFTDGLTGVLNRKSFDRILKGRMHSKNRNFSLIMIDLDYFKEINDTFGHTTGDEALIDMVEILRKSFRKNDLVARYGGDEFCVITDIVDTITLEKVINRLKFEINNFNIENKDIKKYELSASVGYQIFSDKFVSPDSFINSVDKMMYKEKKRKHEEIENKRTYT